MRRGLLILSLGLVLLQGGTVEAGAQQLGDVAIQRLPDQQSIRFTLFTTRGSVGFAAGETWSVIALQSFQPVMVTAFEVPDPADQGTKDSTNLAVMLFQPGSDQAKTKLSAMEQQDAGAPVQTYKGWTIYTREAKQGETPYTIKDAWAPTADVTCGVRLAWPRLASHTNDYDARMDALMKTFLDSVQGQIGAYQLHPGEIVRRPDK
jgi:hypothetical protein